MDSQFFQLGDQHMLNLDEKIVLSDRLNIRNNDVVNASEQLLNSIGDILSGA